MSCVCHACTFARLVGVPAANLVELEKKAGDAADGDDPVVPTKGDCDLFRQCYRRVRRYASQHVFGYGGFSLALAFRAIATLHTKHPTHYHMEKGLVALAEHALPAAFATGIDMESLCAAFVFVATMWPERASPRLAVYLANVLEFIPMQTVTETHLVTLLQCVASIGPPWPPTFLNMLEHLCVLRFSKMNGGVFAQVVQHVGEVVVTTEWEPSLLAFLVVKREAMDRVPSMTLDEMHRVIHGVTHLGHLVSKWDLGALQASMETRLAELHSQVGHES